MQTTSNKKRKADDITSSAQVSWWPLHFASRLAAGVRSALFGQRATPIGKQTTAPIIGTVLDISMVKVTANSDEFHNLQLIKDANSQWRIIATSGATGTKGKFEVLSTETTEAGARAFFEKQYKLLTGLDLSDSKATAVPGYFKRLDLDLSNKTAVKWQYYSDDGVDGKADGWYDYDLDSSEVVERIHDEYLYDRELSDRLVRSGNWSYRVSLIDMIQTNSSTNKRRRIRRVVLSRGPPSNAPPPPLPPLQPPSTVAAPAPAPAPASTPASTPLVKKQKTVQAQATTPATVSAAVQGTGTVDPACALSSGPASVVHEVMLNQVNIGQNNNKYYVIQLIESQGDYYLFTRWDRVGGPGQTQLKGPMTRSEAQKSFNGKFKDKTGNDWGAKFSVKQGKYEPLEMLGAVAAAPPSQAHPIRALTAANPSSSHLDPKTRSLVEMIFDGKMVKEALINLEIDVAKMPLGRLAPSQIARGVDILEEIESEIISGRKGASHKSQIQILTSKFYQLIPHSFPRSKIPTLIDTPAILQAKYDLCNTLLDVEALHDMATNANSRPAADPVDQAYDELSADLILLPSGGAERSMIAEMLRNTRGRSSYAGLELLEAWSCSRKGEDRRFSKHADVANRKLLWHGTNVAVVASIIKSGLRIMPHSGGRVGSGIYLASECGKSAWYVRSASHGGQKVGIMFLVEAALGNEHPIVRDDPSLRSPPPGFQSVVAQGQQEPDPASNHVIKIEGKSVTVPKGIPKSTSHQSSSFLNSEFLIYDESQHRIRYLLTVKMP